jgi:hypothetical protein
MRWIGAIGAIVWLFRPLPSLCQSYQVGAMKVDIYESSDDANRRVSLLVPAGTDIAKAPFYSKIKQYLHGSTPNEASVAATPALLGALYARTIEQINAQGYAVNAYTITFQSQPP